MNLTAVPFEVRPPAFFRWALTVLFAAAVVVGLLGMHTLSMGHDEHPAVSAPADHGHAEVVNEQSVGDVGCADCGSSQGHEALMLVCVLGLLVALLLIARPEHRVLRARGPDLRAFASPTSIPGAPRPLSLHELSISRT